MVLNAPKRASRFKWTGATFCAAAGAGCGFLFRDVLLAWIQEHLLIVVAILCIPVLIIVRRYLRRRRLASSLREIDRMDGHEFERYLARLFTLLGYRARVVGGSGGDFGADIIIEKAGIPIAVQAKNYETGRVGNDAVQQAIAGATYYDCRAAMVVTNTFYTKAAMEQARGCTLFPVTLWNRRDIEAVLLELRGKSIRRSNGKHM